MSVLRDKIMEFKRKLVHLPQPEESTFAFMRQTPWFQNCGKFTSVTQETALANILSIEWENFQLDRRGDITVFLAKHYQRENSEWNTLTHGLKSFLASEIFPNVVQALHQQGLNEDILPSVQWDLLSFMQEEVYSGCNIPRFYDKIMATYSLGRLPYGWSGQYPEGILEEY